MSSSSQERQTRSTIVFTGGGTAGHILPGLAVAERLLSLRPSVRIAWVGCGKDLECRLVTEICDRRIEYHQVRARPIYRRPWRAISAVFQNAVGLFQAIRLLRRLRPERVVATGGYACLPTAIAAWLLRIPLLIIEPNLVVGRANRLLARHASLVCLGHESAVGQLPPGCNTLVTGVPVRQIISRLAEKRTQETGVGSYRRLMIVGGSSGDRWINSHVPRALQELARAGRLDQWHIMHQTGAADYADVTDKYTEWPAPSSAHAVDPPLVAPYFDDLPERLAGSDLVISRAGASTIAELAVLAVPTILIPFAHAADDHQRRGARVLADARAAVMIDPQEKPSDPTATIIETLIPILEDKNRRATMAERIRQFGNPGAADEIAARIAGSENIVTDRK